MLSAKPKHLSRQCISHVIAFIDFILSEGPTTHDQPTYASVPGIKVYGMVCVSKSDVLLGETQNKRKAKFYKQEDGMSSLNGEFAFIIVHPLYRSISVS